MAMHPRMARSALAARSGGAVATQQRRTWAQTAHPLNAYEDQTPETDPRRVKALYRQLMHTLAYAKVKYSLPLPMTGMKKRLRLFFEMNKNVTDPEAIKRLIDQGYLEMRLVTMGLYPTTEYLTARFFGSGHTLTVLDKVVEGYTHRELVLGRKRLRDKARAITHGAQDIPALPGPVLDDEGNRVGYYHPKGELPAGESEIFARPPSPFQWSSFSLPDPWNPENAPNGPPDPNLSKNVEHVYRVNLARMGPYNRHRTRRLVEHEKHVREMSEAEYLDYFGENEVHVAANQFELPDYAWAESRLARRKRRAQNENQEVFGPARSAWIAKYKGQYKAVNYAPAVDYWLLAFQQWTPNYNRAVVEKTDTIDDEWSAFLSTPAHHAAYRSGAYCHAMSNPQNPLTKPYGEFVANAVAGDKATATKPYDHPAFENKFYTDNGLEALLLVKDEQDYGIPHAARPVLHAELARLKEEVGCVELTEQAFKGEWWTRGQIKLLRTLAKIHDMELCRAIVAAAGAEGASYEEAVKKIAAKNWADFKFEFSYLRYPDGASEGIHAWRLDSDSDDSEAAFQARWKDHFLRIFNYEQTVPVWVRGLSRRSKLNTPVAKGGWTLEGEAPFYDKLVSA